MYSDFQKEINLNLVWRKRIGSEWLYVIDFKTFMFYRFSISSVDLNFTIDGILHLIIYDLAWMTFMKAQERDESLATSSLQWMWGAEVCSPWRISWVLWTRPSYLSRWFLKWGCRNVSLRCWISASSFLTLPCVLALFFHLDLYVFREKWRW